MCGVFGEYAARTYSCDENFRNSNVPLVSSDGDLENEPSSPGPDYADSGSSSATPSSSSDQESFCAHVDGASTQTSPQTSHGPQTSQERQIRFYGDAAFICGNIECSPSSGRRRELLARSAQHPVYVPL